MKFFALFLLATSVGLAADLSTGQAARLVIGQTTFTAETEGATQTLLGGVSGVALANNTLFVADSNRVGATPVNHRVLIYTDLSSMIPKPTDMFEVTRRCPACVGKASVVLGQPDFITTDLTNPPTSLTMRAPSAVASDGVRLAIADSDNNRVLLYNSIPVSNQAAPDVVLGQIDFASAAPLKPPTASSLRGPQGVWFQNGQLFVADTLNNRVLIWNRFPTANATPADVVLGQADFTASPISEPSVADDNIKATTLFSPVSVTSDGVKLYVTDLGYDRVLIWNSIPSTNQKPADVVIGQPDMTSWVTNNSEALCPSDGVDEDDEPTYPARCDRTLSTPRFALSDGQRLFIADAGNDRVLVYNSIPTTDAPAADMVLGQQNLDDNVSGSSSDTLAESSADSLRTPTSLAWDGTNLYVADPFNRRIMVFTVAERSIAYNGVRNSASRSIHALGTITISGSVQKDDEVTVLIGDDDPNDDGDDDDSEQLEYVYKLIEHDTLENVVAQLVNLINAGDGDPLVYATANLGQLKVVLTAREEGADGNDIPYSVSVSDSALVTASAAAANLSGGNDAAKIAPGTLVEILGEGLADQVATASMTERNLPTQMAGVQFYVDGIPAPLLYVSPQQINAQIPFEIADASSVSAYVRVQWNDGRVTVTNPVAVPIVAQNPGIFAYEGLEPRAAVALHSSSQATGTISVDGTAAPGDIVAITIEDRKYSYTVQEGDTLTSVRDGLVALASHDPKVEVYASGIFTRIRLRARVPGPVGNGIKIGKGSDDGTSVLISPFNGWLCCANVAGAPVTTGNPALPGETILIYATGLGKIKPELAGLAVKTGAKYDGPVLNEPLASVSALAGGKTANVLYAGMMNGAFGLYEVHLELNSSQPTDDFTQLTIAQDVYVSNITTIPVYYTNGISP
jgi:uncharacterized protein (TIGR03437 family)